MHIGKRFIDCISFNQCIYGKRINLPNASTCQTHQLAKRILGRVLSRKGRKKSAPSYYYFIFQITVKTLP